ncbi:Spy/CpxP family protein refolding chaperone [Sulfurimonas sp.]|jgi:Spy/CpxP family protein refolding chaperone|uniref:Spy/CpxP family protein refolding chaperone n=1 Tax=Sulfurimonas sp. TaxID=2022749 RepID=UPI0025F381FE|nr:Spy/CpxP family protein refolding chaperone [Sulfurimonas sp.]MCK9472666.1 Spy/CpxP family protein refolding chaperone [Sulfurimonas sp.]MDD3505102.1 Spy/CpxP family protein refolding chaperone [Sulfurimonas sp.]
MNKRILMSLGLAVLLTSSLAAGQMNCDKSKGSCAKPQQANMKHNGHKNPLIAQMMSLDLSDKQREEIRAIMRENMQSMPKISSAFSDKAFDKELFIKLSKERQENRIEKKAQMIASVYAVLTPAQKAELRKMLDKKMAMKKR